MATDNQKNTELSVQKFDSQNNLVIQVVFTNKQRELFKRLDEFYKIVNNSKAYLNSNVLRGGFVSMSPIIRQINPDWMSQAAHSFRDIIYPFYTKNSKIVKGNIPVPPKQDAFQKYGSVRNRGLNIGNYYGFFSNVAHHNFDDAINSSLIQSNGEYLNECKKFGGLSAVSFEKVSKDFEDILFDALSRQFDIHNEIDGIMMNFEKINEILSLNNDARRYFFAKADERWLGWLWQNGFLDAIKQKSDDPTKYSYQMPELGYLETVAPKDPRKVAEIIMAVNITKENFNPEVVERFLRIIADLPPAEIVILSEKIKNENWVKLMGPFNRYGFDYKKMLETLANAKEYDGVLNLAEAILSMRDEEGREAIKHLTDELFYIGHLEQTEVFQTLSQVDDQHAERAFKLLSETLAMAMISGKKDQTEVFDFEDVYYLYDVDFFSLELDRGKHYSSMRNNIKDLAAIVKDFAERLIGKNCGADARRLYDEHIAKLSYSCGAFWRFSLFVWSLCPAIFKEELITAFFEIFRHGDKYHELFEVEYLLALKKGFSVLLPDDKSTYIKKALEYFSQPREDKKEEVWWRRDGCKILSCVFNNLSEADILRAQEVFGRSPDKDYKPEPKVGSVSTGWVKDRSPVELPVLSKMTIKEIANNLRGEWSPISLYKKNSGKSFFDEVNAEGMGNRLKEDMALRSNEYLDNANLFFEKGVLDEHYTYSYLRGLHEIIEKDNFNFDLDKLLDFLLVIRDAHTASEELKPELRSRELGNEWLANILGVHNEMAELLNVLLSNKFLQTTKDYFEAYRNKFFTLISYLLNIPDSELIDDETIENKPDPLTRAINSARGRAFEALALFICIDDKKYSKESKEKIDKDVQELYKNLLANEKTTTMMFMFGHYLPIFYYRDRKWAHGLFDEIFPKENAKYDLFIAAVEGYLNTNLYKELFDELKDIVYSRVIALSPSEYTKRSYSKGIDESLSAQLALAYIYFLDFDLNSELFIKFWAPPNTERHEEFVSFIGRHLISRDDPASFMKADNIDIEKIQAKLGALWDWVLEKTKVSDNSVFKHFGFWVGEKQIIFTDLSWLAERLMKSLERSGGDIEWGDGLFKRASEFVEAAPELTLRIFELYLLFQTTAGAGYFGYSLYMENIILALKILYGKPGTKAGVESLINELITKGSSRFWEFKKVLE